MSDFFDNILDFQTSMTYSSGILGRGGEVFFPKFEDQMLTFSAICDDFVAANGLEKEECSSDAEAKKKASALNSSLFTLH